MFVKSTWEDGVKGNRIQCKGNVQTSTLDKFLVSEIVCDFQMQRMTSEKLSVLNGLFHKVIFSFLYFFLRIFRPEAFLSNRS